MKEKIIKKSEELFLTLGFKNVTMDDIATGLGISKKTIYAHFSNKTELVSAVTFSVLEYIYKGIEQIKKNAINPIEELYDTKLFLINFLKFNDLNSFHSVCKIIKSLFRHALRKSS